MFVWTSREITIGQMCLHSEITRFGLPQKSLSSVAMCS